MNKITADHLSRRACVYIRQSTPDQVQHNLESQRRQYGLVNRARALGWQEIDVIDDDLGVSGSGTRRAGFERLLRALCDGQVGAVFSVEASRLARNGRDWHTLLEFCSVLKCARGEGHPLWVLTVGYPGGKTRQVSLRPEQVPQVRKALEHYRDFKQTLEAISLPFEPNVKHYYTIVFFCLVFLRLGQRVA